MKISPKKKFDLSNPVERKKIVDRYDYYLSDLVGLREVTRKRYLYFALKFLAFRSVSSVDSWASLSGAEIGKFVKREAQRLTGSGRRAPITATRSLLRFLVAEGLIASGLEKAIPTYRQYRHASLPVHLSEAQILKALSIHDADTPTGLRNRAILLMLLHLGIRAKEVIELRLNDIDWTEGKLTIWSSKSLRQRSLPLPYEAGQALVDYLRDGRPKTGSRSVFLRTNPPHTALTTSSAISQIVHRSLSRAGIRLPRMGAHVFRHTAATRMLSAGACFKDIADVLGHRSIETTAIYAKLDLRALASVALPWPGGDK